MSHVKKKYYIYSIKMNDNKENMKMFATFFRQACPMSKKSVIFTL